MVSAGAVAPVHAPTVHFASRWLPLASWNGTIEPLLTHDLLALAPREDTAIEQTVAAPLALSVVIWKLVPRYIQLRAHQARRRHHIDRRHGSSASLMSALALLAPVRMQFQP